MTTKRPTSDDAPSGASDDIHRVAAPNAEELIRRAEQGDKFALFQLYGHASAWARGGTRPIPEPLGTWIADRLLDVARVIRARKESDVGRTAGVKRGGAREMEAALAVALRVRRAGTRGRTPSPQTLQREESLTRDVLHFMEWEGLQPEQAIRRAVEYDQTKLQGRTGASAKTYAAAWRKHGERLMAEAGLVFRDRKRK